MKRTTSQKNTELIFWFLFGSLLGIMVMSYNAYSKAIMVAFPIYLGLFLMNNFHILEKITGWIILFNPIFYIFILNVFYFQVTDVYEMIQGFISIILLTILSGGIYYVFYRLIIKKK